MLDEKSIYVRSLSPIVFMFFLSDVGTAICRGLVIKRTTVCCVIERTDRKRNKTAASKE